MKAKLLVLSVLVCGVFAAAPAGARTPQPSLNGCALIPTKAPGSVAVSAPPVGTGTCPGVRPGAIVKTPVGQCTFNFLFNGSDGARYMGTAGHCILTDGNPTYHDIGEQTWASGTGPVAQDADGRAIGRFVYAILKNPKDFALIRLNNSVAASPAMCHFGGPTSVSAQSAGEAVLHYFGNGIGMEPTVPARTAYARDLQTDWVYAAGLVTPGDSGGAVIDDAGRAVGLAVTLGPGVRGLFNSGTIGITRITPQVARAQQVLGLGFTLQTAALI